MNAFLGVPAMAWWGLAAGVPILIHLLSRRRYRRVPWAAMDFLERAFKKTRRRLKLENLLLLLLRVLAVLLLALALADPRVAGSKLFGGVAGGASNVILIMDDSFSTDVRDDGDVPCFARAKTAALRILAGLDGDSDAAAVITCGAPAKLVLPLNREIDRVEETIAGLEVTHAATDVLGALRIANGFLSDPATAKEFVGGITVYVLSDLQKAPFLAGTNAGATENPDAETVVGRDAPDPAADRLFRQIKETGAQCVLVDVGVSDRERVPNVAVTDLRHVGKTITTGMRVPFEVRIKNFGESSVGGEIQFLVDREDRFEQKERVIGLRGTAEGTASETEQSATFFATFDTPGWHYVAARYTDDGLGIDNVRRLAVLVRDHIRVLSVYGNDARQPEDAATFFVARALDPFIGGRNDLSPFRVKDVSSREFQAEKFEDYDLVVLADVAQVTAGRAGELERFVKEGGALFFFPGKSFETAGRIGPKGTANAMFHRSGQGLLPGRFMRTVGSGELTEEPWFTQLDRLDHPALAYFADEKIRPALTGVPITKFIDMEIDEDDDVVSVLARFRRGTGGDADRTWPAIVDKRLERGRVVTFLTSADTTWNLYGATPVFVPLLRELAFDATRQAARANVLVGETLVQRFPPSIRQVLVKRGDTPAVVEDTTLSPDRGASEYLLRRLDRADVIRLEPQGSADDAEPRDRKRVVTVNVDPAESDLARADRNWLSAHFGTDLFDVIDGRDQDIAAVSVPQEESRIWRIVLWILLGVLVFETLVARKFGRSKSTELQVA